MTGPDTLRAAAQVLSERTEVAHGPALAGLLHNRPMTWNTTSPSGNVPAKTFPLSLTSTTGST